MSKREYQGDPIDMAWKSGPWANDGETVYATDPEEDGTMELDEWPENATDPRELNDDMRAVIMAAVRNPGIEHANQILELVDIDKSRGYPNWVLSEHWPEKHKKFARETDGVGFKKISDSEIENIRKCALDGESAASIADDYGISPKNISGRLKGNIGDDSGSEIPPLRWDGNEWVVGDESTQFNPAQVKLGESDETDTDGADEEPGPDTDIEPSPVYGSSDDQETGHNSALKAVALFAIGFLLGRTFRGDSA